MQAVLADLSGLRPASPSRTRKYQQNNSDFVLIATFVSVQETT